MKSKHNSIGITIGLACSTTMAAFASEFFTNETANLKDGPASKGIVAAPEKSSDVEEQLWNWHVQNTDIVQGYPGFSAKYSGPNSLPLGGQTRETVSLDLTAGRRLWRGAEAHIDGMMYQGFGVGDAWG